MTFTTVIKTRRTAAAGAATPRRRQAQHARRPILHLKGAAPVAATAADALAAD